MAQPQAQVSYQSNYYDDHYEEQAASIREQRVQPLLCAFDDSFAERVFAVTGAAALGRPVRVFEAGCGEGLVAAALRRVADRRGIELEYTGCDLSGVGLELLAETVPGTFLPGDAVQVAASLPEASADIVVAKNLLHHIDDPDAFLVQAARVAGPAGHVLVLEARLAQPLQLPRQPPLLRAGEALLQGRAPQHACDRRRRARGRALRTVQLVPVRARVRDPACRRPAGRSPACAAGGRSTASSGSTSRLTRLMPWLTQYTLWQLATPSRGHANPAGADASSQRAWQQDHYDMHYPRHVPHVREQLAHPLFRSFNDRLAGLVLGLGGGAERRPASTCSRRAAARGCSRPHSRASPRSRVARSATRAPTSAGPGSSSRPRR